MNTAKHILVLMLSTVSTLIAATTEDAACVSKNSFTIGTAYNCKSSGGFKDNYPAILFDGTHKFGDTRHIGSIGLGLELNHDKSERFKVEAGTTLTLGYTFKNKNSFFVNGKIFGTHNPATSTVEVTKRDMFLGNQSVSGVKRNISKIESVKIKTKSNYSVGGTVKIGYGPYEKTTVAVGCSYKYTHGTAQLLMKKLTCNDPAKTVIDGEKIKFGDKDHYFAHTITPNLGVDYALNDHVNLSINYGYEIKQITIKKDGDNDYQYKNFGLTKKQHKISVGLGYTF